jgi:hypothetical protein
MAPTGNTFTTAWRLARSGLDRLDVAGAGFAQVCVHVDETGRHHQARRVEDLGARAMDRRPDRGHDSAADQHVRPFVPPRGRVNHSSIFDE